VRRILPVPVLRALRKVQGTGLIPPRATVDFGDIGATTPLTAGYGFSRGTPIDRHYIGCFLEGCREDIRGRVLEIENSNYIDRYGSGVTQADVLHVSDPGPGVTIVADLREPGVLEDEAYDCLVVTQMLHLVYDMERVLRHLHQALKPGGVMLATVPGITPVDWDEWRDDWYWSLTANAARKLFSDVFGQSNVEVVAYGNVLAATCLLQGIAVEDIGTAKLAPVDPSYPVTVAIRARRER
jgi:SAM-dependent methyltransferase